MLRALRITLGARGYDIMTAHDSAAALNAAIEHHPDLVMLDLGMPRLDGLAVIEGLRGWTQVPILVVSGRTGALDKVQAFDAGADDYMTKPFSIGELLARIRALSRRLTVTDDTPVVEPGEVTVDLSAKNVTGGPPHARTPIRMTPTEWRILEVLLRNPGKLVTRQTLLTEVWGAHHTTDTGSRRLYLGQLRKKLEADASAPVFC